MRVADSCQAGDFRDTQACVTWGGAMGVPSPGSGVLVWSQD